MSIARLLIFSFLLIGLSGCGDMIDDLNPSGKDKSSLGEVITEDFIIYDIDGNLITIFDEFPGKKAIVLYFTMWCSACDSEMSLMQNYIIPDFPDVTFFAVDYDSATVNEARENEGNAWPAFTTLADIDDTLDNAFDGAMGVTVVIDSSRVLRMKELFDDGKRLRSVLEEITTP